VLNLVSVLIGLVALVVGLVGLIPLVGIVNWLALPIAAIGAAIGLFAEGTAGRNLNIFVILLATLRLWLGGGIL
jgi:hypothetical protein